MTEWFSIIVLGIIEGLTEFIPVSSTGHLLIAEHWLGRQSDLFNIVIQSAAVIAVLPLFKDRLKMLSRWREPASQVFIAKIAVAFVITGIGGLALDRAGFELPETMLPVALALIVGGILFIVVEKFLKGRPLMDAITWKATVMVAFGQLLAAVFPGASRSGSTIIIAMLCGANRVVSTEFSFLVGIPTMLAAGGLKIFKALRNGEQADWGLLLLGAVISGIVSFIAVRWLLRFVQNHTFIGFGVYRIFLAIFLFWVLWPKQ